MASVNNVSTLRAYTLGLLEEVGIKVDLVYNPVRLSLSDSVAGAPLSLAATKSLTEILWNIYRTN